MKNMVSFYNASKWHMGINSAFKGLIMCIGLFHAVDYLTVNQGLIPSRGKGCPSLCSVLTSYGVCWVSG